MTLADVEAAAPSATAAASSPQAAEPTQPERKPRRGFDPDQMRQAIAAAMSRDGHTGGKLLATIDDLLQQPEAL